MRGRLILLTIAAFFSVSALARAQDNLRALIERGIESMGGAKRIDAVKAGQSEMKGTLYQGTNSADFTQQTWFERPDKYKGVTQVQVGQQKVDITLVFNGDNGWIKSGGGPARPFGDKAMSEVKEERYQDQILQLTPLLGRDYQLAPLSEIKVNGRPALGLRVTSNGHRAVDLYVDKATGLPVETLRRALDYANGKEYTQAKVFSDYKATDGLKTPSRVVVYQDGKKYMVEEVVKVKYLPEIEASVFAKP